jgi:hypothetical protein
MQSPHDAMHRVARALQTAKAIGQRCEKTSEKQVFLADRIETELLSFFPMIFSSSKVAI